MSWYRQGTVSVANGATAVAGTLTGWVNQVLPEDAISFDAGATWYEVAAVASNTALTLATAYTGSTITNGAYAVQRLGRGHGQVTNLSAQVAALLAQYPALGGAGDALKIIRANAGGTALEVAALSSIRSSMGLRETLTANRTYYVRTDGNNANDGLSNTAGGAWATLARAQQVIAALDLSIYNVTVQLAPGTYTDGFFQSAPWIGSGRVKIRGDTANPAATIVSTTNGNCLHAENGAQIDFEGLTLQTTTAGFCVGAVGGGRVTQTGAIQFGAGASGHILCEAFGNYQNIGHAVTIAGSAPYHVLALTYCQVKLVTAPFTLSGTPAFSTAFVNVTNSYLQSFSNTFSGAATGRRAIADVNGIIQTYGAGLTHFPGDVAVYTGTQGQYL